MAYDIGGQRYSALVSPGVAAEEVRADYERSAELRMGRMVVREEWRNGGLLNHPTGPAIVETDQATNLRILERWYAFGYLHREDHPAHIATDALTGIVTSEDFWTHGRPRRPTPGILSVQRHARTGIVRTEIWSRPPKAGPSCLRRDGSTGVVISEEWSRNGLPHRSDGPAIIRRDRVTGEVDEVQWWIDGRRHARDYAMCSAVPDRAMRKPIDIEADIEGRVQMREGIEDHRPRRPVAIGRVEKVVIVCMVGGEGEDGLLPVRWTPSLA